jgi:hypothetical protein
MTAWREPTPLQDEQQDLIAIAAMMAAAVPDLGGRLGAWRDQLENRLAGAPSPLAAERVLDEAVLALRHVWLEAAASSTSKSYRSPAEGEKTTTPAGRFHNFGYERDLQPVALERRCANFFDPPPPGWTWDHVLFSSGQAAMNALLTLLSAGQERAPRLRHDGCYFETAELLGLYGRQFDTASHQADIVIAEPVWCDGKQFGSASFKTIAARANAEGTARIVIDSTLAGLDDGLNTLLAALDGTQDVFRLHSGLKLFQAGLELADVGIVSFYGSQRGDELRRIRTLQGSGLRFADVAALELPLFLDPETTRRYEDAIFWHNRALAEAARGNPAFAVSYPAGRAPFVIFNLPSTAAYDGLDEKIATEAGRRSLVFTKGGSFGFRGHRFETVHPEGKPPFLRVAMGKRAGPSFEGVLELFRTFRP